VRRRGPVNLDPKVFVDDRRRSLARRRCQSPDRHRPGQAIRAGDPDN